MQLLAQQTVRGSRVDSTYSVPISSSAQVRTTVGGAQGGVKNISMSSATSQVLFIIFLFVVCVYVIVTGVLFFHWKNYALGDKKVILAELVYFIVSISLLIIAIFSIA